jgi:hypothetical protein
VHNSIHNLSGAFINTEEPITINNQTYYCFSLTYPNKSRYYYLDDKKEYNDWLKALRAVIKAEILLNKYELGVIK